MDQVKAAPPEDVVVTLEHPSFGTYTFREQEGKIAATLPSALARAHKEGEVYAKCAELDAAQNALQPEMARVRARVAAAETLGDKAAQREQDLALEKLQAKSQGFAETRMKLLDSLK